MNQRRDKKELTLSVLIRLLLVFLPGTLLAAFTSLMLILNGAGIDSPMVLELVYGGGVITASGFSLLIWTRSENISSRLALAILLGSVCTSLVLAGGCLITGLSAGTVFVWWSLIALSSYWWASSIVPAVSKLKFRELVSIFVIGLCAAIWCRRSAALLPTLHATGVINIWSDYFIHATEIAQFGDPLAAGQSAFLLVKQPIVFYHYASYMIAATVAGIVNTPALGIAASVWLPCGIFLASLGSYAFVRSVAGEMIAILAALSLLVIPDASTYGFQNGFFGFHWLLFTAPGSGYGIAVAFAAITLVVRWHSHHQLPCLWLGLLLAVALFEFRAQIFLLFAPSLGITLLWETKMVQRRAHFVAFALLIVIAGLALTVFALPPGRDAWLHFSACAKFLELVHTGQSPTAYDGLYRATEQHFGQEFAWIIGLCAIIPIALGAMTVTLPLALYGAIHRTGWQPLDSFPFWCIATWLGLMLLAPNAAYGGFAEYQHRPFVLVYAISFAWTLIFVDRAVSGIQLGFFQLKTLFVALCVAAIGVCVTLSRNNDPARPRFTWGNNYFDLKLEPGLLEAAAFTGSRATSGDVFALIPTERSMILTDAATRFAALANVPAYLARAGFQVLYGRERRLVVEQRLTKLNKIEMTDRLDDAFFELRKMGVAFLVVLGPAGPRFDPTRSRATFQTDGAAVYRVSATTDGP